MVLSMTRPWKHPKTRVYWLRKRVPATLQPLVGKTEEKHSVGTKDLAEAKRLLCDAVALHETLDAIEASADRNEPQ